MENISVKKYWLTKKLIINLLLVLGPSQTYDGLVYWVRDMFYIFISSKNSIISESSVSHIHIMRLIDINCGCWVPLVKVDIDHGDHLHENELSLAWKWEARFDAKPTMKLH